MRPYQEEYIANLKNIAMLTARKKSESRSFEEYVDKLLCDEEQAERKMKCNMELLRDELFPVLDHMYEADEKTLQELNEFAGALLAGKEALDAGLFIQIHKALLSLARMKKDRSAMIRELYWLGMGYNNICNKLIGMNNEESERYTLQMRLCFTEAAAYLKYYDEIEEEETKGYILRSRANMALGRFKNPSEKIHMVKRTLQILQDKDYQKKTPELPWDRYVYMTHQQMAASISYSKEQTMTPQDIADVMESVYIVYQRRLQEAAARNEQPPIRSRFAYYAIEYYCGLDNLDGLLTKMEALMDRADVTNFSEENMYGLISIPAFYCQYLNDYPEKIPERREYIESLYQRVLDYVEVFPKASENEALFLYLRQLSYTFVETEGSITYKDFLQKLQIRFAPEIYVHSRVVAEAAVTFCGIIMEEEPDFFDDIDWIREIRDKDQKRQAVFCYAKECGMLYDIGKINFMDLYAATARQWFEEEYEIAHLHTLVGEAWLSARESTRPYAPVALGHHYWYDASRGYPKTYKRLECQYRQMVDVIGLLDWLDNVTDSARLYKGVEKTFDEALQAAVALEGRRFSPLLTARLRDREVAEQIRQAFEKGRYAAYHALYAENGN